MSNKNTNCYSLSVFLSVFNVHYTWSVVGSLSSVSILPTKKLYASSAVGIPFRQKQQRQLTNLVHVDVFVFITGHKDVIIH